MPANLENSTMATGLEKLSFHASPQERQCWRMLKLLYNYIHLTHQQSNAQNSPSQASPVSESWLPMFSLDLEKAEEWEFKLPTSIGSSKNQEIQEHLLLINWLCQRLWLWITKTCGKFIKRWEYQTKWHVSWEIRMQAKKQQLGLDMKQQTGSR